VKLRIKAATERKVHALKSKSGGRDSYSRTYCNKNLSNYTLVPTSSDPEKVTCSICKKRLLEAKNASVGITKFPAFDGDLAGLKTWMKQMGLTHMDEYADHIDFYGEHFNRLVKVTWKQVRNRLWKSVEIEDVKGRPSGKPLDD
jgi:hypothetical protein